MDRESIDEPLVPLQRPTLSLLGINPAYANHDEEFVLKLQEKRLSVSGDDFYIVSELFSPVTSYLADACPIHRMTPQETLSCIVKESSSLFAHEWVRFLICRVNSF